jgi:hypothetical protein
MTTRSDLSLPFISPLYLQPPPSVPPKFYRLGGTFEIRAIQRSETDRIMLDIRASQKKGLDSGRKSMKLTAGGLDETSYVTRLIPATSFVMREDIFRRRSGGKTYLPKRERFQVKLRSANAATSYAKGHERSRHLAHLPFLGVQQRRGGILRRVAQWTHQSAVMKSSDWTARNAITWP